MALSDMLIFISLLGLRSYKIQGCLSVAVEDASGRLLPEETKPPPDGLSVST